MKCPHCGAWSDVLSTRDGRRRRQCANNHRFSTLEAVVQEPLPLRDRDEQILKAVREGQTMKAAAASFGLRDAGWVGRIVRRLDPAFDARAAGQAARSAKKALVSEPAADSPARSNHA